MAERTEISFEVTPEECAVLDGYCSAKNIKRTQVMRQILRDWSIAKHSEAILIVRVAGNKPMGAGTSRDETCG